MRRQRLKAFRAHTLEAAAQAANEYLNDSSNPESPILVDAQFEVVDVPPGTINIGPADRINLLIRVEVNV